MHALKYRIFIVYFFFLTDGLFLSLLEEPYVQPYFLSLLIIYCQIYSMLLIRITIIKTFRLANTSTAIQQLKFFSHRFNNTKHLISINTDFSYCILSTVHKGWAPQREKRKVQLPSLLCPFLNKSPTISTHIRASNLSFFLTNSGLFLSLRPSYLLRSRQIPRVYCRVVSHTNALDC